MHIEPDSCCAICGARRQLEVHHIEPRRMGGSSRAEIEADTNKVVLCRTCHTQITEQRWHFERTPELLTVREVASGVVVVRRHADPTFQAPAYFEVLQALERGVGELLFGIPYLTDDQLVELFHSLGAFDRGAWKAKAAILWEAKQRSVYGDRAWEAMGKAFGIGWRQAYNLARVWQVFFAGEDGQFCNQMQTSSLDEVTWYIAAAETDQPKFWLAYAEDRKAENPCYTVADFRDEIRVVGARREDERAQATGSLKCRWVRVYCARLDQVVSPDRCSGCDELNIRAKEMVR